MESLRTIRDREPSFLPEELKGAWDGEDFIRKLDALSDVYAQREYDSEHQPDVTVIDCLAVSKWTYMDQIQDIENSPNFIEWM